MGAPGSPIQPVRTILVRLKMAATLALDPLVRPGIEQQRHLVEVLQEMEEPGGGNKASAPGPRKGAAQSPRNSPRKSGGGGSRKQGGGGRKQGGGGGRQSGGGGEASSCPGEELH